MSQFLLFSLTLSADLTCSLASWHSAVNVLSQTGEAGRGLLSSFNLPVNGTFPGYSGLVSGGTDTLLPYVSSLFTFAGPILVFFAIFFIGLPVHQCFCWCPFCRPKEGRKRPGIIKIVLHLAGCGLLVATAAMFFFAAAQFTAFFDAVVDMPEGLKVNFEGLAGTISDVAGDTFDLVEQIVNDVKSETNAMADYFEFEGGRANDAAHDLGDAGGKLDAYQAHFSNVYAQNISWLLSSLPDPVLKQKVGILDLSLSAAVANVKQMVLQFADANVAIIGFANATRSQVSGSGDLVKIQESVSEYRNDKLPGYLNQISGFIDDLTVTVDDGLAPVAEFRPTVNGIVYTVCGVFLVIAIVYAIVYFFNCCLARCLVTAFPMIGWLLTVVIILPGAVLSLLFYPLHDICPVMEETAGEALGSGFFKAGASLKDLLAGEKELPLLDFFQLPIDPKSFVQQAAEDARKQLDGADDFSPDELNDALKDFGKNFSVEDDLSPNTFHMGYAETLEEVKGKGGESLYRGLGMLEYILRANETQLVAIRNTFKLMMEFSEKAPGAANQTVDNVNAVIDKFVNRSGGILDVGLKRLNTTVAKCVYAPLKNAICDKLISGIAFWTICTICLIVGIFYLEASLCVRRRSMVKAVVGNEEEEGEREEAERDRKLDELQDQKFQERTKRRRLKKKRKKIAAPEP